MEPSEFSPKLKRIVDEGLVFGDPTQISAELMERIETLTDDEINYLIQVKAKLADLIVPVPGIIIPI